MTVNSIKFSPGIVKDDTATVAEGAPYQYADGDNVRFYRTGAATRWEPVGGFEDTTIDFATGTPRSIYEFTYADGAEAIAVGTTSGLFIRVGGVTYDVTPAGMVEDAGRLWSIDNYEQYIIACPGIDTATVAGQPGISATGGAVYAIVDPRLETDSAEGDSLTDSSNQIELSPPSAFPYYATLSVEITIANYVKGTALLFVDNVQQSPAMNANGVYEFEIPYGKFDTAFWLVLVTQTSITGDVSFTGDYAVQYSRSQTPQPILNSPENNQFTFVGYNGHVTVLGSVNAADDYVPLLVKNADPFDFTIWDIATDNQADESPIKGGVKLVAGARSTDEDVLWTNDALSVRRFTGDPIGVFRYDNVGSDMGIISQNAFAMVGGRAFWMTPEGRFMAYGDGAYEVLDCPVQRFVYDSLSQENRFKIFAWHNSRFDEVWWHYPTTDEPDKCVIYNYRVGSWSLGTFDRTAMRDRDQNPYGIDPSGNLYEHEKGDIASWSIESARVDISDGESLVAVRSFWPDFKDISGTVIVKLKYASYPAAAAAEVTFGSVTSSTLKLDSRLTARQIAFRYEGDAFVRGGNPRVDTYDTGQRF